MTAKKPAPAMKASKPGLIRSTTAEAWESATVAKKAPAKKAAKPAAKKGKK